MLPPGGMAPARGIQPLSFGSKPRALALDDTGKMAPRQGFEPRLTESESVVLPLNERGKNYGVVTVPKTGGVGVNKVVTCPTFDGPEKIVDDPVGTASTSYEYWVAPATVESL